MPDLDKPKPLFCELCLERIWRPIDGGPMVDSRFGERHMNCSQTVETQRREAARRDQAFKSFENKV